MEGAPSRIVTEPGVESVTTDKWVVPVAVVAVGLFMALLDVTVVNVAIPAIQFDFGGSLEDVLWIATAYTLTLGVVVPLSSWFGDRFGLTRLYIGAVLGFALTSGLCGLAWNLGALIAARILQAIPGGILPVLCVSLLYRIVPKDKVGTAMGMMGVAFVAAPAVGPVVGGYLVEYVDWRLVFYINLPIGLLTVLAALFVVPRVPKTHPGKFDVAGFVTIAIGLFALLLAASKGQDWGWTSYRILILLVVGTLVMGLFVVIELQVKEPLLDLRLFGIRTYSLGVIVMAMLQVNLLASSIYIPVFLQQGQGLGAYDAGLVVAPQALAMCVASVLSGQLYDKVGTRLLTLVGCGMTLWGNLLLCNISASTTHQNIIIWTALRGFGMSLAAIAALTAAVNCVEPKRTNQASALENVSQQIPGAFGIAILASLLTSQQAQLIADRAAMLGPDSMLARVAAPAIANLKVITVETPGLFALFYRAAADLLEDVMAHALSNMFLVLGVSSAVCVLLAFLLPLHQPAVEESEAASEPTAEPPELVDDDEEPLVTVQPVRGKHRRNDRPDQAGQGPTSTEHVLHR